MRNFQRGGRARSRLGKNMLVGGRTIVLEKGESTQSEIGDRGGFVGKDQGREEEKTSCVNQAGGRLNC